MKRTAGEMMKAMMCSLPPAANTASSEGVCVSSDECEMEEDAELKASGVGNSCGEGDDESTSP